MYRLSVLMSSRDRTIFTQKTIESIHINSKIFNDINIYLFDNYSDIDTNRLNMISKLLNNNLIKYYSYDTNTSSCNCFPKAIGFKRWVTMMIDDYNIRLNFKSNINTVDYYVLIDNDMLVGPGYDEYFITASEKLKSVEPNLHYLVKYPGGVTKNSINYGYTYEMENKFQTNDKFNVISANFGGGSGFWFMSYEQLLKLQWGYDQLKNTYNSFKKHDTTTWNMIKEKNGNIRYVGARAAPKPKSNPLVIHLGGIVGSICNALTKKDRDYNKLKPEFILKEKDIENMNCNDIFDKYKENSNCYNW